MSMFLDRSSARTIQRQRAMTIQTELVRRLSQLCVVSRAMRIVAAEARHPASVHYALYEIIPLHAILVRRAIGIVCERSLAQRVLFKLPKISQV